MPACLSGEIEFCGVLDAYISALNKLAQHIIVITFLKVFGFPKFFVNTTGPN